MKTNRIITSLTIFSIVIFMGTTGISNPAVNLNAGNLEKSGSSIAAQMPVSNTANSEFSYLRFDVNTYATEAAVNELPVNAYDYLRFDISAYSESAGSEIVELPVAIEFEYLRFDCSEFTRSTGSEIMELPETTEFEYLCFDVSKYASPDDCLIEEMLASE